MICTGCGKPLTYPFCSAAVVTGPTVHQPINIQPSGGEL